MALLIIVVEFVCFILLYLIIIVLFFIYNQKNIISFCSLFNLEYCFLLTFIVILFGRLVRLKLRTFNMNIKTILYFVHFNQMIKTFIFDFLEILKHSLTDFQKVGDKYLLGY